MWNGVQYLLILYENIQLWNGVVQAFDGELIVALWHMCIDELGHHWFR